MGVTENMSRRGAYGIENSDALEREMRRIALEEIDKYLAPCELEELDYISASSFDNDTIEWVEHFSFSGEQNGARDLAEQMADIMRNEGFGAIQITMYRSADSTLGVSRSWDIHVTGRLMIERDAGTE